MCHISVSAVSYWPRICITKYASVYSTAFIPTTYTLLVNPDQPRITAPRTRHADSSISYQDTPRTIESSAISQIGHESAVYWHIELTRNMSDNLIRKQARTVYKETVHMRVMRQLPEHESDFRQGYSAHCERTLWSRLFTRLYWCASSLVVASVPRFDRHF